MNPDDTRNIYNQEIKPIHKIIGIGVIVFIAVTLVLQIVSLFVDYPRFYHVADTLTWVGAGALYFLYAYFNRKINWKFTLLLLMLGAGAIILAFTHFIYLSILFAIGSVYVAIVTYRRIIKPILKEQENKNP